MSDLAVASTLHAILQLLDPQAKAQLSEATIHKVPVLSILSDANGTGRIEDRFLEPLAQLIAIWVDQRIFARPSLSRDPSHLLIATLSQAMQIIKTALSNPCATPLQTIQTQLHQVFLFAVTASLARNVATQPLQDLTALIQVFGMVNNMQIAPPLPPLAGAVADQASHAAPGADIGTSVYACTAPTCTKIFLKLVHLRVHERVHDTHRPYACTHCSTAFARNHDLRRHLKSHGRTAFKCSGCSKTFSRRDAIKRHQENARRPDQPCLDAGIEEIDVEAERGHRKGKNSHGGVVSDDDSPEEGELAPETMAVATSIVLPLHALLQSCVSPPVSRPTYPVAGEGQPSAAALDAASTLSPYNLGQEQTAMVEQAIASALAAAQAQAEAEAMLEDEYEDYAEDAEGDEDAEGEDEA